MQARCMWNFENKNKLEFYIYIIFTITFFVHFNLYNIYHLCVKSVRKNNNILLKYKKKIWFMTVKNIFWLNSKIITYLIWLYFQTWLKKDWTSLRWVIISYNIKNILSGYLLSRKIWKTYAQKISFLPEKPWNFQRIWLKLKKFFFKFSSNFTIFWK